VSLAYAKIKTFGSWCGEPHAACLMPHAL